MGPIVAIGGGDIRLGETAPIDREIIRLTGKESPRGLFIPTASGDSSEYCQEVGAAFGRLGATIETLLLLAQPPSQKSIEEAVARADFVYVGGGSTLNLMKTWRRMQVDRMLREAHARGVVLSGLSAGANCWFEHCHSDSSSFFKRPRAGYMRVRAMGLIKGTFCPHYIGEERYKDFPKMIAKYGGAGYAVDNRGALVFENGSLRPVRCSPDVVIHRLFRKAGEVIEEEIVEKNFENRKNSRSKGRLSDVSSKC